VFDGLIEPIYNIPTLELSEIEGVIRQFPSDLEVLETS
jgi:hypothetical protein